MTEHSDYLMENDEEILRLEIKTDIKAVHQQARWAGIKPGMRVLDIGCGPGKTTRALFEIIQPGGEAIGIDVAAERIAHANENYCKPGMRFEQRDAREPIEDLGDFDFIWVRFLLEYHGSKAFQMVQQLREITKPGGIVCLIDLDYNCLSHYGMPERLVKVMRGAMFHFQKYADFDPHVGIKLYSFLYDLNFEAIDVTLSAHHLIFGELGRVYSFNWTKKAEVAAKKSGVDLDEDFPGGYQQFIEEFRRFFTDPRRFTYTPLIACRGVKPYKR
jgi:ubiquinone/menaquinone biosynthesis C-methylase UbiE